MADESKSLPEEILPIRQNLVDTAVSFLMDHNVKQKPNDAKLAFLKKKGLTDSEIIEAFNRSKYGDGMTIISNKNEELVNAYPLPPYQRMNSFWFHLRNYSSVFVGLAVAVYVLHRFYKMYIEPWLFGLKSEKSELSELKEQLMELNNSVARLTSSVASLEEAVSNQIHHQMDRSSLYGVEVPNSVRDILEEVSNVKGLLLNRFSFPAPPSIVGSIIESKTQNEDSKAPPKMVSIPKWQLRDSELEKSNEGDDGKNSNSEPTSSEKSVCAAMDEKNDATISKEIVEVSSVVSKDENSQAYLENNLCVNGEIQSRDLKTTVQNQFRIAENNILDEDSDIGSNSYLSDSESYVHTSRPNEHYDPAKNSE